MARLSNIIEDFIKSLLSEAENGIIEIQRNELAQYFDCAPSQINYVLTTRFTLDKGYYIESRRGGGGYIKIVKVNINNDKHIQNLIINLIGDSITKTKSFSLIDDFMEENIITEREGRLMKSALSDRSLQISNNTNQIRANILKNMLLVLIN
ncbi:transcriptional regulator CtsR [Gottschalkia purinilytica]|uniref:Transcriptional regulator CtsR n=1 Tax=Gottschalkia purinilytica TaxID=1503 RepID=A0A0L0W969_GOTPU|nr:CtsR family transcriptional regulator [Gottschalkia purinilytica]KNF07982.1 transcriptional regulator CtsR [Gottschalkia purinilytica]